MRFAMKRRGKSGVESFPRPMWSVENHVIDNAEALLVDSDLVLCDPIETGFSRPEKPEFAPEFLNMKGDVAATVEFIRASRFMGIPRNKTSD